MLNFQVRAALCTPLMRANLQEARSQQALLAARALARLAGVAGCTSGACCVCASGTRLQPALQTCVVQTTMAHPAPTGMLPEPHATPPCAPAQAALASLLTESLAARLAAPDPRPLLGVLGSASVETAHVIWNNSMREELLKVG